MTGLNGSRGGDLDRFVEGEDVNAFGLHLIGTPDTKTLVESVARYVQEVLDKGRTANKNPTPRQTISYEIIPEYKKFASGEMILSLQESVRGKHVYAFIDPQGNIAQEEFSLNDKLIHGMLLLNAIRTNGARSTNLITPYMPYARQDHPSKDRREPSSLEMIAEIFSRETSSNGNIITVDLHNPTSKSSFGSTTFINLFVGWLIEKVRKDENFESPVLSGADQGGDKKITSIAKELSLEHITVVKKRNYTKMNTVEGTNIYGEIQGKDVILHDDIVDTGGTLCTLIKEMLEKDPKSITVVITHGLYNNGAFEKIEKVMKIAEEKGIKISFYSTNSVNKVELPNFIKQIDITTIIGNTLVSIFKGLGVERNNGRDYTK